MADRDKHTSLPQHGISIKGLLINIFALRVDPINKFMSPKTFTYFLSQAVLIMSTFFLLLRNDLSLNII